MAVLARWVASAVTMGAVLHQPPTQDLEPRSWADGSGEPTERAGLDGNGPTYLAPDNRQARRKAGLSKAGCPVSIDRTQGRFPEPRCEPPQGWLAGEQGDLALLELHRDPPPSARPALLGPARAVAGHACAVHGYPVGHDGVSSEPVVTGQTVDRIQLTAHPGWYFTGRSALLQEPTGWLESGLPGRAVRVVTGPAWTGKSAVPAWLCALSDPQLRAEIVGGRAGRRSSCPSSGPGLSRGVGPRSGRRRYRRACWQRHWRCSGRWRSSR